MLRRIRAFLAAVSEAYRNAARVSIWLPGAVVVTYIVLADFSPFDLNAATDARSQQVTLRLVAPYYEPSRNVAVVLIDDEYLRERQAGWPLRFGEQGRLLRQIASAGPAVILVDFVYPHRHGNAQEKADGGTSGDTIGALLSPIENTQDPVIANMPVVFTAMAKDRAALPADFDFCPERPASASQRSAPLDLVDPESLPEELAARAGPHKSPRYGLGYVRWSRCGDNYPLLLGGDERAPTPVFEAYRVYCKRSLPGACKGADPTLDPDVFVYSMVVREGAFPPPEQKFAYSESVCQRPAPENRPVSRGERFMATLQQATLGVLGDLRKSPDPQLALPCPALSVIPMSRLQAASRVEWEALLKNKAVVLGADISGIPDFINSPVHGQIPGAVWHGMALDNLVSLGDRYLTERHPQVKKWGGWGLLLAFAYVFPFILFLLEHKQVKQGRAWVSFTLWILLSVAYFGAGFPIVAILCLAIGIGLDLTSPSTSVLYLLGAVLMAGISALLLKLGLPPGNWLSLLLVAAAFGHTLKAYCRGSKRKPFPALESVLRAMFYALVALRNRPADRLSEPPATGE